MKKTFYRVSNIETNQGLWYDINGQFTGLIHNKFNFCKNNQLTMDYDKVIVGWLSATETIDELFNWFTEDDIKNLEAFGYFITSYETENYKKHNNHWVICQSKSVLKELIPLNKIEILQ